jgi:hypothetical protein
MSQTDTHGRPLFTHLNGSRHGCAALNFIFERRKWQEGSRKGGDLYRPLLNLSETL